MATTRRPALERRHWLLLLIGVIVLLAYGYLAAFVLPEWLVSPTAGKADANAQLNAVTSTRAALLGVFVPLVVLLGGIAAFLAYRETAEQNRHTNELARLERDETRRLRRATAYADLLSAAEENGDAAEAVFRADQQAPSYVELLRTLAKKRNAMSLATDRVRLLGSDALLGLAGALDVYCAKDIGLTATASPKPSEDEWKQARVTGYAKPFMDLLFAARHDLELTR